MGHDRSISVTAQNHTVLIKLICADAHSANVLCEEIRGRLASGKGLSLTIKAEPFRSKAPLDRHI